MRAERLGIAPPANLIDVVLPGSENKARELMHQGSCNAMTGWEVPLVVAGKPTTAVFSAQPYEDGTALLGSLITHDYVDAIAESNRAVHELVAFNRELARQKTRLEEFLAKPLTIREKIEPRRKPPGWAISCEITAKLGITVQTFAPLDTKVGPVFWGRARTDRLV